MTYSIDAARAQRFEATGEDFKFEYGGKPFTLPRELPVDAIEALAAIEATDSILALRQALAALLGKQAARLDIGRLSAEDIEGLLEAWSTEVGISLGESAPSSSSSPSTARRSKPTSRRPTASTSRASGKARSAGGASKS